MSGKTIGIVDLHTHLLPHMDDGSKDTAMSLEMLRRQAEQGVNVVCATSHFYAHEEPPEAFCKRACGGAGPPAQRHAAGCTADSRGFRDCLFCGHRPREGAGNAVH